MANGTPTFTRRDAILGGGGLVLGILGRSAMDLAAPATPEPADSEDMIPSGTTPGDFSWWTEDSPTIAALTEYVEAVCDPDGPDYIPPESRIVVSDMDGTFLGELCPIYFDWAMFIHRALYDGTYTATQEQIDCAHRCEEAERTGTFPDDLWTEQAFYAAQVYAGMTIDELTAYVHEFGETEAPRFTGLKRGDAFYKPMLQVIQYLLDNNFIFYTVSGTDRFITRALVSRAFPQLPASQAIGTDNTLVATNQGEEDGFHYTYEGDDEVVMGGEFIVKDLRMNKVIAICKEIGLQPIMGLGNSTSDSAMLEFVMDENPLRTMNLFVLADDTEREWGNPEKSENLRAMCEEKGWTPVSTANEWVTIYGEDVAKDPDWEWSPDVDGPGATA